MCGLPLMTYFLSDALALLGAGGKSARSGSTHVLSHNRVETAVLDETRRLWTSSKGHPALVAASNEVS
jgi:hypothetical protein